MDRAEYIAAGAGGAPGNPNAAAAHRAADSDQRPALDTPDFCAAIEAHGAIVVAEDDWWGSRAAGQDIDTTADPIRAIFEKYYFDAPSPRVFPSDDCRRLVPIGKHTEVDGVIFYLPHEDDVIGWDYPRLRAFLDERCNSAS